jgi:hypothetical protein
MFKKLFCCSKNKVNLEQWFHFDDEKPSIIILSGLCCNPLSYGIDEKLKNTVNQALATVNKAAEVRTISVTEAREHLSTLSDKHSLLVENIQSVFQSHGLKAFPALIINGKLAFYGGAPSADMLVDKLR